MSSTPSPTAPSGGPAQNTYHRPISQSSRQVETKPPKMPDPVTHPAHYTQCVLPNGSHIECIDVIEALNPGYHLGNVIKYIWRWNHKGDRVENLKKARWYLDRAITLYENGE